MKKSPIVSLIVLTHNALEYTKVCIDSIKNSKSNIPSELIIVDNGSDNKTKDYLKDVDAIKFFSPVNLGVGRGRNIGFKLSSKSCEFVCNLDNDVVVPDYWIDEFIDVMRSNPQVGIIGASSNVRVLHIDGFDKDLRTEWFEFKKDNPDLLPKDQLDQFYPKKFSVIANDERTNPERKRLEIHMPPDYIPGWCQFFRKSAVGETPIDPEYPIYSAEDIDFCWNIAKNGYRAIYDEKVYIHHFRGQSAIAKNPKELAKKSLRGYAYLSKKWSNEILKYLNFGCHRQINTEFPYMSGSMIQYLVDSFGFFIQAGDRKWILNNQNINEALAS